MCPSYKNVVIPDKPTTHPSISDSLYQNYKQGMLLGNLCSDLCNVPQKLVPRDCQVSHYTKEVVFQADWRGREVVVVVLVVVVVVVQYSYIDRTTQAEAITVC